MVNHTMNKHCHTVIIITLTPLYSGYNYMVNHTRNKHCYTVAIITWLIILGTNTIIQWL